VPHHRILAARNFFNAQRSMLNGECCACTSPSRAITISQSNPLRVEH
jgi:hypothetical protein